MSKRFAVACLLFLLGSLTVVNLAAAQAVYGNVFGTVTDPSGAAVPSAKVTVTDIAKGTSDTVKTNSEGNYTVTHLIPDKYSVVIEAPGFKKAQSDTLTIFADTGTRYDAKLQVGNDTETIEVTSEAPQLKTDRSDVSTTFNTTDLEELPIINRNFTQIELLSPGAQYLGWGHAATENPQASQQIMVNGQHFS